MLHLFQCGISYLRCARIRVCPQKFEDFFDAGCRARAGPAAGCGSMTVPQQYLYPPERFVLAEAGAPAFWTCARTRPRWEKKFAAYLAGHGLPHFLPVYARKTHSGRKTRENWLPLFPGYVFVEGDWRKQDFLAADAVVRLLKPQAPQQIRQLHTELWQVWRSLIEGVCLTPVETIAVGELCDIIAGPLWGVQGRYERPGRQGRLVLRMELLGVGVAVEVPGNQVRVVG